MNVQHNAVKPKKLHGRGYFLVSFHNAIPKSLHKTQVGTRTNNKLHAFCNYPHLSFSRIGKDYRFVLAANNCKELDVA